MKSIQPPHIVIQDVANIFVDYIPVDNIQVIEENDGKVLQVKYDDQGRPNEE